MKMLEFDDQVFIQAYSYDICKLIGYLDSKRAKKGEIDYELKEKMEEIENKVKLATFENKKQVLPSKSITTDEDEEEDEDDYVEEDLEIVTEAKTSKNMSKRNSVWSRHGLNPPGLKRMNTNMSKGSKARSNHSGRSAKSGKSVISRGSRRRSA